MAVDPGFIRIRVTDADAIEVLASIGRAQKWEVFCITPPVIPQNDHVPSCPYIFGDSRHDAYAAIARRCFDLAQMTSEPNWNAENDKPISGFAWLNAWRFASHTVTALPEIVMPFISPCGDGIIHLNWRRGDREVNVEIEDDRFVWYTRIGKEPRTYDSDQEPGAAIQAIREHLWAEAAP